MQIDVLQEHIDRGHRRNPYLCPVALAFRTALSEDCAVMPAPGLGDAWLLMRVGVGPAVLPDELVDYMRRFDNGETVVPRSFDVPNVGWPSLENRRWQRGSAAP